jgi:hypothetical protein
VAKRALVTVRKRKVSDRGVVNATKFIFGQWGTAKTINQVSRIMIMPDHRYVHITADYASLESASGAI